MEKIRFHTKFITESDDAVVCKVSIIPSHYIFNDLWDKYYDITGNAPEYKLRGTYKGVAVRKSGDESDIATAKEIARKKALRSAYRDIKNYANFMYNTVYSRVAEYAKDIDRLKKKADTLDDEIKDIVATWEE